MLWVPTQRTQQRHGENDVVDIVDLGGLSVSEVAAAATLDREQPG